MNVKTEELRRFAEAMLDVDRLKIVGELVRGAGSVERLSREVGMPAEQVRSHLRALRLAGVVSLFQRAQGELVFRIDSRSLERMSRRQFARVRAEKKNEPDLRQIGPEISDREAQIVRSITYKDGRVRVIPGPNKLKVVRALVRYAMQFVEPDRTYTEKELGRLFAPITNDPASIRRYAVDLGHMDRSRDGARYWRTEPRDA
jgi:hypothetical protein